MLGGGLDALPTALDHALCVRDDGQERFFLPRVVAIRGNDGLLGAAVVLSDVTKFRLVDQLKSDMVSTVSHELKTPLTGMQMAVHLLLEEAVGPLNAKQTELLLAARQDSDRLLAMINDLLDLTRIEQGRVRLDLRPVAPASTWSRSGRPVRREGSRPRRRPGDDRLQRSAGGAGRFRAGGARVRQPRRQRAEVHRPGRHDPALGRARE